MIGRFATTAVLILACLFGGGHSAAAPPGLLGGRSARPLNDSLRSRATRADAWLADVCFVDTQHGWAVGDRGTIWHTADGGGSWRLQPSGVWCRLESVSFIDPQIGWAAGGYSHPYTHTSSGVLLATRDGGKHWRQVPNLILPAVKQIRFFDESHGWLVGCSSSVFPSGGFRSENGGRSWTPLSGPRASGWSAADFVDPLSGALVGRNGEAAVVRRGGIEPARTGGFGMRDLARVALVRPTFGWLIGDGALVMLTADLGLSWQTPPGRLPETVVGQFDFHALAVRGPKCWVAGSPGTQVVYTADAGRTWRASPTGQRLPISGLAFVDDQHGWAVGALGTILATADGGQSWHCSRKAGARAALLGMFARGEDVPLELFARLSGNEGYLGIVEVLGRRDPSLPSSSRTHPADRVHEAVVGVGASGARTAWRFPLRQAGLGLSGQQIRDGWNRANDGRGDQELQGHLVRQIRLWRPEVIVTHDVGPNSYDPLPTLAGQAVLQAVSQAAEPMAYPQQITHAGLEPWQVKKVYGLMPAGGADSPTRSRSGRGTIVLTANQLAGRLGHSLSELASGARGLLECGFTPAEQTLGFRLLANRLSEAQGGRDFFSGIVLPPGSEARRELIEPPPESIDRLRRIAQRQRNTQAVLRQSEQDANDGAGLLGQVDDLTRGLDAERAGRVLFHLAGRYARGGRWELAAETYQLLVDRHPQHPLAEPAWLWLLQYYASSEVAWRVQGKQRMEAQQMQGKRRLGVQQASALSIDNAQLEDRPERAAAVARAIEKTLPELSAEPAVGFPLAVADRRRGFPRQAERFYMTRRRSLAHDAWWSCAAGEAWLAEPKGTPPPKVVLQCVLSTAKPRLDGRLDDAVWRRARPAQLESALGDDAQWLAEVMLAYDSQFLYVALRCRRAPTAAYPPSSGPRPRDADLSAHDRVDVFLDLDRDYATYYRLTIDHRGWTGEACWGDRTWDPNWYVAAADEDDTWLAEAAIPLGQLTERLPASRSVWAIGIQRTAPGAGFQSWSRPASTSVMPEGFGYLIFE